MPMSVTLVNTPLCLWLVFTSAKVCEGLDPADTWRSLVMLKLCFVQLRVGGQGPNGFYLLFPVKSVVYEY